MAPYRIETERLVIRCYDPRDAPQLRDALAVSLAELRAWMPWAKDEPASHAEVVRRLEGFRARFDGREDFTYGIFASDGSELLGGTGFHPRVGEGAREIGYWIRSDRTGRGYATESTSALTRAGLELAHYERLEIHVDPRNAASLAVPRKLGYLEEATLRRRGPQIPPEAPRADVTIFSMLREELRDSPVAAFALAAYDSTGAPQR